MSQLAPNRSPALGPARRAKGSHTVVVSVCGIGAAVAGLVLWQATHAVATGISATGQATACPTSYLNPLTPSPAPLSSPATATYRQLLSALATCDRATVLATGPASVVPWAGLAAALAAPATTLGDGWQFHDGATGVSVFIDGAGAYTITSAPDPAHGRRQGLGSAHRRGAS